MCNPHLFGDSIWFIFEFLWSYPRRWSVLVKAMPREKHLNRIYPWLLLFGLVICLKLCVLRILFLDVPLLVLKILNYFLAWSIKDLSMPTDDPINCDHFFDNWPFFRSSIYSLPGHISWYISSLSHIYYISKNERPWKEKLVALASDRRRRKFQHRLSRQPAWPRRGLQLLPWYQQEERQDWSEKESGVKRVIINNRGKEKMLYDGIYLYKPGGTAQSLPFRKSKC